MEGRSQEGGESSGGVDPTTTLDNNYSLSEITTEMQPKINACKKST